MFLWSNESGNNSIEILYNYLKNNIILLSFAKKEFKKSRFGNKKTNPSRSIDYYNLPKILRWWNHAFDPASELT